MVNLVAKDLENVVNAKFAVEPDPISAANLIAEHIETKRKNLGI